MPRTVFLLDVDGVINATRPGWSAAPFSGKAFCTDLGRWYKMRWAPQLISRLRMLLKNSYLTIVWATSWCGDTDQLEELFKLLALPSAASKRMHRVDKADAALAVLKAGDRLIWADDEFVPEPGEDLYDELMSYPDVLLLKPDAQRGLRPSHLDQVDEFMLRSRS